MNFVVTREDMEAKVNRVLRTTGDFYTFDDIMKAIGTGDMQSFTQGDTWIVTQIMVFPRRKILSVELVAGFMDDCVAAMPQLEEFAREVGATRIIGRGRLGWGKYADTHKKLGWKRTGEMYAKEL
jgi:hypothetical protein